MQNEWLSMHGKTIDKMLHEINLVQAKNTIGNELNLNNISFVIKSMKMELFNEMQKNSILETEISGLKVELEKYKQNESCKCCEEKL